MRPRRRKDRAGIVTTCVVAISLAACQPGSSDPPPAAVPENPAAPTAEVVAATPPTAADAAAPDPIPPAKPGAATTTENHWQCGDQRIATRFDATTGTLDLIHERGQLALPRSEAASGARYADLNGNEFWDKADTALLTLSGAPPRECSKVSNGPT